MAVTTVLSKKLKAAPSLGYSLCPEAKDADMVEAAVQICKQFTPIIPEMCYGGKVINQYPS